MKRCPLFEVRRGLLLIVLAASAACGPVRVTTLVTDTPPPPTAVPSAVPPATFTPYPTYAPPTPTATPFPTPTPDPAAGPVVPRIATSPETKVNLKNKAVPWLNSDLLKDFREPKLDEPLVFEVQLKSEGLIWDNWWCAASDEILAGTLAAMKFEYRIDGEPAKPDNSFTFKQFLADGSACSVTAYYLLDWPTGAHALQYTYTITGNLSDGYRVYKPGVYKRTYNVTAP